MKKIIALILLSSCSGVFRGSLLDIEEFSFGPLPHGKTEIIKEVITENDGK